MTVSTDRQGIIDAVMDVIYPERSAPGARPFRAAVFEWAHEVPPRESELLELAGLIADRVQERAGAPRCGYQVPGCTMDHEPLW